MRASILLTVCLALPGSIRAQEEPSPPSQERVSAAAAILLKGSQIAEENRLHLGGWAGLVFGGNLAVGGGGFALLNEVEIAGPEGGTGLELGLGYGGVLFRYWESLRESVTGEVGVLLGAGHAEVREKLTGTEVGADNFLLAEAEMGVRYGLFQGVSVGASVGYRITSGVEDLAGVSAADLNAFTGTLSFTIGGDP